MSKTLLDGLSSLITPDLLGSLAGQVGAPEGAVSKGMSAILPALLGGVASRATQPSFMSTLMGLVTDSGNDAGLLGNPKSLLGSAASSSPAMALGVSLLNSVFGKQLDSIVGKVASFAGISPAAASSMFKFGAPVVLSMLGKKVKDDGLDASGLGKLLSSEKDKYVAAAPSALGSLEDLIAEPRAARAAPPPPVAEKKSIWRWLIPLLIALAIGWYLLQSMGGGDGTAQRAAPAAMAPSAAVVFFDVDSSDIPTGTAGKLMPIISYLKANPGSKASVTGYHDASGDAMRNEELAKARAAAVQQALQAGGIDGSRINMAKPMMSTGSGTPEDARRVEVSVSR